MTQTIKSQINSLKGRVHEYTLSYDKSRGLELVMTYRDILGQIWDEMIVNQECVDLLEDLKYYWMSHGLNINNDRWKK